MNHYYTSERNVLIVIALMKAHGIRKMIASPGTTNLTLIASLQQDSFFEMYSAPDERSAAYMACGLAAESGEPVALSCTGATASRNYMPGLTEAYYRKLPVLAITSSQHFGKIGSYFPQVLDRRSTPNDIVCESVHLTPVHSDMDEWACSVAANQAMLALRRRGGGPAHINLVTTYSKDFSIRKIPSVNLIRRFRLGDTLPELPSGRIAVYVGSHKKWSEDLLSAVDTFCAVHNAVVFCDHTSNYTGKFKVPYALAACQPEGGLRKSGTVPNLLIHIGEVSGDDPSRRLGRHAVVWRVNPDGEIRDTFQKLKSVFEMEEYEFFQVYAGDTSQKSDDYLQRCLNHLDTLRKQIPEVPFSNIWVASKSASRIPDGACLHLGILNSLRSWNLFALPENVSVFANTGGFGIDGGLSSLLGASLADRKKLYFGVFGDLAFFYDMNSLGNRHLGKNLRIMLINNGRGTEFRNYFHPAAVFGDAADPYMAAAGHYGNKSRTLIKHYAENLGFEYLSASSKTDFEKSCSRFLIPEITAAPMLFEIFTDSRDENEALHAITHIERSLEGFAAETGKRILGETGIRIAKKILNFRK